MTEQTLLFSYGCEGGGSSVYKYTVNGIDHIRCGSVYVDFTEECGDTRSLVDYNSFEAFWNEFVKIHLWYGFYVDLIHDDCKQIIRKSIDDIDLTGLSWSMLRRIAHWKDLL